MRHPKYLFAVIKNNKQKKLRDIKEKGLGKIYPIS
jgi:hypothetical protein